MIYIKFLYKIFIYDKIYNKTIYHILKNKFYINFYITKNLFHSNILIL